MDTITKSDELRLHNRSRILACLRTYGSQSRTRIGEITGLSGATVTQVTADLMVEGVIEQLTADESMSPTPINARRGRPQVILKLRDNVATAAVLTLLLNQIEVTLYDYSGNRLHRLTKRVITSTLTATTLKNQLIKNLDSALAEDIRYAETLKHIALVIQGTVTSDNNGLLWSPITKIQNLDIGGMLQSHYSVSVNVSNDCNTIANALYQQSLPPLQTSAGRPATTDNNNFAAILLSYGIGMGFFHRGTILSGSHSSATEFGHMLFQADGALCRCGRRGCIEAYASDYAIWRNANELPEDSAPQDMIPPQQFSNLITIAQQQPGPERAAFASAGAAIGQGLTNLFAIFDPFPTVLVGASSITFELMKESLFKNLRHYGNKESSDYISIYDNGTNSNLIRSGASLQALSYIDREVFGFGERSITTATQSQ